MWLQRIKKVHIKPAVFPFLIPLLLREVCIKTPRNKLTTRTNHWTFLSVTSPFCDRTSSLRCFWLKQRIRALGSRAMQAMASSCSSRSQENKSSSDDNSDSMAPVWTQMKLYGRRPVKEDQHEAGVRPEIKLYLQQCEKHIDFLVWIDAILWMKKILRHVILKHCYKETLYLVVFAFFGYNRHLTISPLICVLKQLLTTKKQSYPDESVQFYKKRCSMWAYQWRLSRQRRWWGCLQSGQTCSETSWVSWERILGRAGRRTDSPCCPSPGRDIRC